MQHVMSLNPKPFEQICRRQKTIEARCLDEKRRKIRVGDTILFQKLPDRADTVTAELLTLYAFPTFRELYAHFDFSEFGCAGYTMEQMVGNTRRTYPLETERKYGALGIRIRLV